MCASTTTCSTCKTGLNLVNSNYCVLQCSAGQINTGTATAPICSTCSQTISQCESCPQSYTSVICSSCTVGYYLEGNSLSCTLCSSVLSNCKACSNAVTCTGCLTGYYLNGAVCVLKGCDSSITNCMYCSGSSTSCTQCSPGFTNNAGTCTLTCPATYIFNPAIGGCRCASGTYESNGACKICNNHCYNCDAGQCYSCDIGYYPSGANCLTCSTNCQDCTSGTSCTTCISGYYVDSTGSCAPLSSTSKTGAATSTAGTVYTCPTGCSQCSVTALNAVSCTTTVDGYSLVGGSIVSCFPTCKKCSGTTSIDCTECYQGTSLYGGSCSSCSDPNAADCLNTNSGFATSCIDGYTGTFYTTGSTIVTGGVCRACASNCHKCDVSGPAKCDST